MRRTRLLLGLLNILRLVVLEEREAHLRHCGRETCVDVGE